MLLRSLASFGALVLSNFLWQARNKRNWHVAAERSLFQFMALVAFVLTNLFTW